MEANQKLLDKFNKWNDHIVCGESGYLVLHLSTDWVKFYMDKYVADVQSCSVFVWDSQGILFQRVYPAPMDAQGSGKMKAIIKGKSKMIIMDEAAGLFSFGLKEDKNNGQNCVLHMQSGGLSTFVVAAGTPCQVISTNYIAKEADPLASILPELFRRAFSVDAPKEVCENG